MIWVHALLQSEVIDPLHPSSKIRRNRDHLNDPIFPDLQLEASVLKASTPKSEIPLLELKYCL